MLPKALQVVPSLVRLKMDGKITYKNLTAGLKECLNRTPCRANEQLEKAEELLDKWKTRVFTGIVYSKTFDEHIERLEAVFSQPEKYGLKLKTSKCSLFRDKCLKQGQGFRPLAARGKSERNYPVHKLEFLGLKWAVTEKFHDYLYGNTFIVRTDNNPLTYVNSTAKLDATGHRWFAALANYNFKIHYRPGKRNADADALSRRPHESVSVVGQESIEANCQLSAHRPSYFDASMAEDIECVETLPKWDPKILSKLQGEDVVIGRVKELLLKGERPTRKALNNEGKSTRKILRLWNQFFSSRRRSL
ncbi:Retrovirus-related Pol polyprotein from transposon opus [Exaiptasia diaphana]|nr:Retrovirus-related Pol polyprotein from transposon opus [Exaiptasia diaphana]